ncbi:hypothetical protein PCANC_04638 [Puccinia coronata f. sp. avenae]|uniref:Uncharacterized protein n=1 Tax=Puccinia coronata f. sp. avenae TaxID=200324 RepID=A0A2N5W084_9BASI|nr:hypothetical protein PCANC_16747 [Puccinia coronata f. sp. avenae]PLW55646.1 hypothetical protein PCANC_04638 [Puccinia coronata f. sp. avenae]
MLAKLVPAQRAGLPARQAGTSPASRPTCSPSWYQPSEPAYLLAELVPAQRAGAPLDNRFVQTGHQEECVLLSTTGTDRPSRGVRTPLNDRDGQAIKRRTPPLDGQRSLVIKRRHAPLDDWSARVRASGPGPSRSMLEGFWIGEQADLLAGSVEVPARRAGRPARWAGTGISSGEEVKLLVGLVQVPARQAG